MNSLSLADGAFAEEFFPFTQTRPVADLRCGILTIREKWELLLKDRKDFSDSLTEKSISVPGHILPDSSLAKSISNGINDTLLNAARRLENLPDLLRWNAVEMISDFQLLTKGRQSQPVSSTNRVTGADIFLEEGAIMEHCIVNCAEGPVYIGKEALVMEGSMIRGPFALGARGVVKMGTRIYGATSVGPHCVIGGEIKNSIFFESSNKAHDGYLGDSVIGAWCNLGAGTSNSNMKNSGGEVRLWNPLKRKFTDAGIKCGLMMGDFSRSAIHTAFNTGSVVGVCCHVFGEGRAPVYLPSFSWGIHGETYAFEKAMQHISRWKKFKGEILRPEEMNQLKTIFDQIKTPS